MSDPAGTSLGSEHAPVIASAASGERTEVDRYWSVHTVKSTPFDSVAESLEYLRWRSSIYPLFAEYMGIYSDHSGETVLDYGCGPGHDTVGFLLFSNPAKVVAMDVSHLALELARQRISLHGIDSRRVALIETSDSAPQLPLETGSVDYINCGGVLHHVSHPETILREFARVLRDGGRGSIMVYNRESIFFHLWIAYQRQLVQGDFHGLDTDTAFSKATDGEDCPISIPYRPATFLALCRSAGLEAEFAGGYFATLELDLMSSTAEAALADPRLGDEHRKFLNSLVKTPEGYFLHDSKTAGHGGVYTIRKAA